MILAVCNQETPRGVKRETQRHMQASLVRGPAITPVPIDAVSRKSSEDSVPIDRPLR